MTNAPASIAEIISTVRAWEAYELNGPVPRRITMGELADTIESQAARITELEKELNQKCYELVHAERRLSEIASMFTISLGVAGLNNAHMISDIHAIAREGAK
jgi:hypothetical protein